MIVSTDGGATWQTVPTNLSNSTVEANGIDGFSSGWVDLTADLSPTPATCCSASATRATAASTRTGFMVDDIQISG